MVGKFFAGYVNLGVHSLPTDIAVFNTEKERDEWVESDLAFIPRIALCEDDVVDELGIEKLEDLDLENLVEDYFDDSIKWIIHSLNKDSFLI